MSRQAGPSIVLSVLIVGFFAVALFERDLPRGRASLARSSAPESAARTSPPAPGSRRSGQCRDLVHTSRATVQGKMSSIPGGLPTSNHADRVAAASPDSRVHELERGRSEMPGRRGSDWPGGQFQQASARATGGKQTPAVAPSAAGPPPKTAVARGPRSAFTIALASETIEDVSSRVYGSAELADSLWRANRDTLPRRDSPLSTGMLLRTPRIR